MVTGLLVWGAEATPLAGAVDTLAATKSLSPVHKAGCMFGTHRCPAGTKWSCAAIATPNWDGKEMRLPAMLTL